MRSMMPFGPSARCGEENSVNVLSLPRQGYFVEYKSSDTIPSPTHLFCGEHHVTGAWCPNCDKPLVRLLELSTEDQRLELSNWRHLAVPLFYCWTCNMAHSPLQYQLLRDGEIRLLLFAEGGAVGDHPYNDYPRFFPGALAQLVPVSGQDQDLIRGLNAQTVDKWEILRSRPELTVPRHQVGGEPRLMLPEIYESEPRYCELCGDRMPLLASIGNNCLDPRGIVGTDFVQMLFHVCPRCSVVGAEHLYAC
jgi:hypothetical protein